MSDIILPIIGSEVLYNPSTGDITDAQIAELATITEAEVPDATWEDYVKLMDQDVSSGADVAFSGIAANTVVIAADTGGNTGYFQLENSTNGNLFAYCGTVSAGNVGWIIQADAAKDIALNDGGTNRIIFKTSTGAISAGPLTSTGYNKVTITAPATAATLTLANNGTLATLGAYTTTLTSTATTSLTLPTTGTLLSTASTIKSSFSNNYAAVVNGAYNITYKAAFAGTINNLSHIVRSLTTAGTVKVQINGVDVTGLTGIVPTVSGNTTAASGANTFVVNDSITFVFASTLAVVDFQYDLNVTRILV